MEIPGGARSMPDPVDGDSGDGDEQQIYWHVNTGDTTIHAKRIGGRFRRLKTIGGMVWLLFFFGPYLRWNGYQALLFDIPNRQFRFFDLTILPQDVWMLSLILLFFAILLAVATSVAGRVYCGYFCFQTVWTDIFTWIEDRLEGPPAKRYKLDRAPWTKQKVRIKLSKHALWILISMLTGISFAAWFTDAFQLWHDYLTLQAPPIAWVVLALFTAGTYILAGFMREQVCFWLCPYARIQGVMCDRETILPTYHERRGEPRGARKKGADDADQELGDCIDCNLCVAVCPTGIDIRNGQQEGCITCALCIDACDYVMDKVNKPRGLISYASLAEVEDERSVPWFKRGRVLVYLSILILSVTGIWYGLTHVSSVDLTVLHERQPLYVILSDGSVQNKYELKILNKTANAVEVNVEIEGADGLTLVGTEPLLTIAPYQLLSKTIFLRLPDSAQAASPIPVVIKLIDTQQHQVTSDYQTMFIGPSSS